MMQDYDICILAVAGDASVANKLAESIRRYKLPSGTVIPDSSLDYRRVYVEVSGRDFDDEARSILDHSRCLAVLCSPETRTSRFILDRLAYFREIGKDNNIIAVIIRGEPVDSFPESFIEKKTVRKILPDMTVVERTETIEPVASDLRAETRSRWKEALNYETVRIIASILGLHPDDLEQRHRMRHRKAVITLVSVIAAVCLGAAGIFAYLGHVARLEGEIADQQAKLCVDIAERTMNELPAAFADEPRALVYIQQAVDNARDSLEELGLDSPSDEGTAVTGG
ncbi:MAG: hypothetical protein IKG17_04835 [Mogibacterium sp.]|jgi:hypothetical protein|nr:hypothetical protein [Mogibacterium sp.]